MAYGAEPPRAGALAQVIYVWPSRELMSRSWYWPPSLHEAFQDAAGRVGLAVAIYALGGRRFPTKPVSLQLSIGAIEFRVRRRGTSTFITVSEFAAPLSRGQDSEGTRQPRAADGLIFGLHGSGSGYYLVAFHGHVPPVPAKTSLAQEALLAGRERDPQRYTAGGNLLPRHPKVQISRPSGGIVHCPDNIPDGRYRVTGLMPDTDDASQISSERKRKSGKKTSISSGRLRELNEASFARIKSRYLH